MQANRPHGTSIEVAVRQGLFGMGYRFFKDRRPLPDLRCEADVVFPTAKVAVFIDGCFWHGCPQHATRPAINRDWWARKLDRTIERDEANNKALRSAGWTVLRFWEHQPIDGIVSGVTVVLRDRCL